MPRDAVRGADAESLDLDGFDADWQPVSPRLVRVRLLGALVACPPFIVAGAVLALVVSPWWWFLAAPFALGLAVRVVLGRATVRAIAWAERPQDLALRSGPISRTTLVVPYHRLQTVEVSEGPLLRAHGLATLKVETAAAMADATIPGLPRADAEALRDRLVARGVRDATPPADDEPDASQAST
ncbi:membrane-flanked domain protein [Xylanimonas cellulosilytica DSM 15894]|uniref:Membrane-flanked domain protein n=1 Tax=Xylanimonas cellulosilytica (strain DSM 15894 / JCM 12276 / CECT 5975 / KCTC 9989 / LMG 20990 / NBRC 107835 / XIL07) TaxID=446471 RepID=D1BZ91_XYLCX|nr:PH domain-containing protein [Xylanimonas cellulosilytica]ACZ31988.1 membrane-flanked domain protein [Xylanimonas cellulosilytica DSM 15894]